MNTIIVIEDDATMRSIIEQTLELEGFKVMSAPNGLLGLELAKKHLPDLILCDVIMPEMDGFEVLKRLRNAPETAFIPLIFLTGKAERADIRQGMKLGADDYLTKPFRPQELLETVVARLKKKVLVERTTKAQMEELRTQITYHLPHELNTPLNGIISAAAFLEEFADCLEPEEIKEMAEDIKNSGKRLFHMTNNFLLYAHLETITIDPVRLKVFQEEADKYFVKDLIRATAFNQVKKANREEDLHLDLEDALLAIAREHICKLIEELIDNALKFSNPGTPIKIISNVDNKTFHLYVIDRGRGMTAEKFAKVDALMQFERKLYEQQGSGLGLAICKTILTAYSGELKVERKEEETIVSATLPVCLSN